MEFIKTKINGLCIIIPNQKMDDRGKFVKIFNSGSYEKCDLKIQFKECYYSISHKNVIRGMHFQTPHDQHQKLVYVPFGKIIDVVLDIRKKSSTYGQYITIGLSSNNGKCVLIPEGCAHGFKSLSNNTIVTYLQSSEYSQANDMGIRYDSFGLDWKCDAPILSDRDKQFPVFRDYDSPF